MVEPKDSFTCKASKDLERTWSYCICSTVNFVCCDAKGDTSIISATSSVSLSPYKYVPPPSSPGTRPVLTKGCARILFPLLQQRRRGYNTEVEATVKKLCIMQRLIQASLEGNTARLTALVDGSLNPRELVNRGNELGMSALHIAVMMGAADCARKVSRLCSVFAVCLSP